MQKIFTDKVSVFLWINHNLSTFLRAIIQNIYDGISQASIVIVDLSNNKPNCYYELGYARALHKHVILISNKGTKLEFDEIGNNCYFYDIEDKNYDIKLQKHILEQMCSKGFFNKKR